MLRCCAIALALRGSGLLRGLIPPPVSDGLGGRGRLGGLVGLLGSKIGPTPGRLVTGLLGLLGLLGSKIGPTLGRRGGRLPPPPTSCGLGGRGILVRRLAIGFLLISFRKILLPLVFQSLQQQSCPSCTGTIEAFAPIVEIHEIQYLPFPV